MQIFIFWWGQFQVVSIFVCLTAICECALCTRHSSVRSFVQTTHISLLLLSSHAKSCYATLEIMLLQLCKIKFKLALSRISLVRINVFGHNMLRIPLCIKRIIFSMMGRASEREMPHRKFSIFQ